MRDLTVTLIQTDLDWEKPASNLRRMAGHIAAIDGATDLIVLPEMFTTSFTMNAKSLAHNMDGPEVRWMQKTARKFGAVLTGSMIIREENRFYNRLLWVEPSGDMRHYDKRHLFRMAGEEKVYSSGRQTVTEQIHGWNIRPFVCYDLRFPAWTRNCGNEFDLCIFVANWPEPRSLHWKVLLQARAIENLCYVVGVNRVGKDGRGHTYSGDSTVIDPAGKILFQKSHEPAIHTLSLSRSVLDNYRLDFPAWKDADTFQINTTGMDAKR